MKFNKTFILCLFVFFIQHSYAAQIIRLTSNNMNLLPKGKEVDGRIGDWILKNDKVIAVIGSAQFDREANQMVSSVQGAVIDFTTLAENNDQLTVFYPQGGRVDVASADTIIILKATGTSVQLKAIKFATQAEPFTAETTYTLTDGKEYLNVSTIYKNTSASPIKVLVYDLLRCDNKLKDITPAGKANMAFIYNDWYNSAYGVLSPAKQIYIAGGDPTANLITMGHRIYYGDSDKDVASLDPGKEITVSRILLTGKNLADLQSQQIALQPATGLKKIPVFVKDKNGKVLSDVFITARNSKGDLISSSLTEKDGNTRLYLPAGEFTLMVTKLGHDTVSVKYEVKAKNPSQIFTLRPETRITFSVADDNGEFLPVKVDFRIVGGKKINLGPGSRSNGNANLYFANQKDFSVPVPEGEYEIVVTHGAEYDAEVIKNVKAISGKENKIIVKMHRAFTSPGYIIGDLHNHTTGSGDSNAGRPDRVIDMAAVGIEFAPATEHNRISSYDDVINELGLQKFIKSAAGIELSGRPGPGETNHQIAFPLLMQPEKRGNGAPKTDTDPFVQMKRLYDYDNGKFKLMQQNHPDISDLYFDKNKDGVKDAGYGTEKFTDVMEIRETMFDLPEALHGGNTSTRSYQWLQMLNLGYHILGTANTDAHAIMSGGSGSIFNYIYSKNDQPEKIDAVEIAHEVKDGHVILSNGPFMTVKINDELPGSSIKAMNGKVNVDVKILTANWCKINTVQLIINGKADSTLLFTKEKNPSDFSNGVAVFNKSIPVALKSDAHIIVLAYGQGETTGLMNGDKKIRPMAMSNPVFVDIDGNGFTPNMDLMGHTLPAPASKHKRKAAADAEADQE